MYPQLFYLIIELRCKVWYLIFKFCSLFKIIALKSKVWFRDTPSLFKAAKLLFCLYHSILFSSYCIVLANTLSQF